MVHKVKYKTRSAANDLESLKDLISQFFYNSPKVLIKRDDYTWDIEGLKGSYIVKLSKGRYYFKEIRKGD